MNVAEAMAALPVVYADALRLREEGVSPADIARTLEVPGDAVANLLRLADAKLARLLGEPE